METWRTIPGYEGIYEASSLGRVRSLARRARSGRRVHPRIMKPTTRSDGYLSVSLWRDNVKSSQLVHRVVLLAFRGDCPPGLEALHRDGARDNNAIGNLEWGTHAENMRDQLAHGTNHHASRSHCAQGHEFTPENTYYYPRRTHRACRTCWREWVRVASQKRKQEAA